MGGWNEREIWERKEMGGMEKSWDEEIEGKEVKRKKKKRNGDDEGEKRKIVREEEKEEENWRDDWKNEDK